MALAAPRDTMDRPADRTRVDLHAHTTASDGTTPPAELVRLADAEHLAALAVTDHDTTDGLAGAAAAAAATPALRVIAGVEVSAVFAPGTLHVLGLGIDPRAAPLWSLMDRLRAARDERNPKIVARLAAMGMAIDMDDVRAAAGALRAAAGRILGRVHIAEALRRKGHVADIDEAFARLIGDGCPAYVDKERIAPPEAMACIHAAGGLAVLAHPVQLRLGEGTELERFVRGLAGDGLDGIEVYHSDHDQRQTRAYLDLAVRLGLLVSGGSDFHGQAKPLVRLGRPVVPVSVVRPLLERLCGGSRLRCAPPMQLTPW